MVNKLRAAARQMMDANAHMDVVLSLLDELKEDDAKMDVPWDEYRDDLFGVNDLLKTNYETMKKNLDDFRLSMLKIYEIRIEERIQQLMTINEAIRYRDLN